MLKCFSVKMFKCLNVKMPRKGFTLIELIVAIFILALGITAVFAIFPLGIQIVRFSKMTTTATHLGGAKIEEIISKPYNEIFSESKQALNPPFDAYSRETEVSCVDPDLQEVVCDYDLTNDPNPIKKIEVTVSWRSSLKITERSVEILTLISKK